MLRNSYTMVKHNIEMDNFCLLIKNNTAPGEIHRPSAVLLFL
jgi:hypothetical protein